MRHLKIVCKLVERVAFSRTLFGEKFIIKEIYLNIKVFCLQHTGKYCVANVTTFLRFGFMDILYSYVFCIVIYFA